MSESHAFADVGPLLAPRSIAVIGASDSTGNFGGTAIGFLRRFGYPGKVYPVNPRRETVGGLPCFPDVASLPAPPDIAVIALGSTQVAATVRQCAAAGIHHGIAWAGGFAEIGATGAALQEELVATCRDTGFSLLGPNCIGIINSWLPMPATFASFLIDSDRIAKGNISMVSQSGGLATMSQALAQQLGHGFRAMVSVGNEAVLSLADFIHALARDDGTRVIAAYVEGVRDGDKFVAALVAAREAGKPVVLLKGGMTAASARAALAHTGAFAGEGRVWQAILAEEAVVAVESMEEMLDVALFLATTDLAKLPAGPGVAAVTFGGGGGVLAADQCARRGLTTPPLSDASRARLRPLLPPIASLGNPLDVTPQTYNDAAYMAKFPAALDVIAADDAVDTVLLQCGPMGRHAFELADAIRDFRNRTGKAVCLAWPLPPAGAAERSRANGFHVFGEFARAINAIAQATQYRADRDEADGLRRPAEAEFDWAAALPGAKAGEVVSEDRCHALLRAAGLCVAAGALARSEDEAAAVAGQVGYPLAMKGISPTVTHRAKAGLVVLNIRSPETARATFSDITARAAEAGATLDGIYVQRMSPPGREVLVSAFRDPVFGVMLSCGAGGALTETLDDVVLARAPVSRAHAETILSRLRAVSATDLDIAPLAAFVATFSQLAAAAPWREFVLEVNPVIWNDEGAVAVDGLLVIEAM